MSASEVLKKCDVPPRMGAVVCEPLGTNLGLMVAEEIIHYPPPSPQWLMNGTNRN